jgi:hypothetical protein
LAEHFPIPELVITQIVGMCRNFLWTGDILKSKSALVTWRTVCLPKNKGGLGLFEIKACNESFIAKQLWNIHLKTDSIWIQWIHYYYLSNLSIWDASPQRTSSPLWKSIISFKDQLIADCGGQHQAIALLSTWSSVDHPFLANAYDFLRLKGTPVSSAKVVWEPWSMPGYNFILWLALMGKLRTRDRLRFLQTDPSCVFCRDEEESCNHLFFACHWTSVLW